MTEPPFRKYQQAGLQHGAKSSEPEVPLPPQEPFQEQLMHLINQTSQENDSGTPDFVLARYLTGCLDLFNETIQARAQWRGEPIDRIFNQRYDKKIPVNVYNGRTPNQIGEAELEVWPGEIVTHGRVIGLVPIFAPMPESGFPAKDEAEAPDSDSTD